LRIRTRLAGLAVAAALAAACGSPVSPAPSSVAPNPSPRATPSAASSATPGPSLDGSGAAAAGAAADPGLFSVIPIGPSDGLTFQYDPDTTARVATDEGLARDATALAIGLYTVTGQQPVADYAIASIIKLRNPTDDDWFRAYRDSYDASACAQAGGITRHAEAPIGGRTVFIGSCAGGAFTYHLRLDAAGLVVSITGVGPGRLGERVAGLVKP
jgi:hypothetical protein